MAFGGGADAAPAVTHNVLSPRASLTAKQGAPDMNPLISEGLSLMVVGMGAVFVFLTLLVFTTNLMSRLVARLAPPPAAAPVRIAPDVLAPPPKEDKQLLAVITAAIHKHRSNQK